MDNIVKRKLTVREILDAMPAFREWITNTKLYSVIVEMTHNNVKNGIKKSIISDEIVIDLSSGISIRTPYNLPIEMIYNFYINSPFYKIDIELEEEYLPLLIENNT